MSEPLLEVEDLTIEFGMETDNITAVSDASFTVEEGEYMGLVGESGSGKSTIAKALLGALDRNGRIVSGKIRYKGEEIQDYTERQFNERIRWKEIAMIPQASMNSLDPIQPISEKAIEIAETHTDLSEEEALDRFEQAFEVVGLPPSRIDEYSFQFSGGMRQRAIIALTLFLRPTIVIADEPTTALDVIMQDQVLNYIKRIREETDSSMIMITHDISVVFETCDSMTVMHSGQIAETGPVTDLYDSPRHPYLVLLQEAFPDVRYPDRELEVIEGYPPQLHKEADFCTFADRCPWAIEACTRAAPELEPVVDEPERDGQFGGDHRAACIRKDEIEELNEQRKQRLQGITGDDRAATGRDER